MAALTFKGLAALRAQLGYQFGFVVRLTGIARERLAALEAGAPLTIAETDRLARIYGLEADQLLEDPITASAGDAIVVLAQQQEFTDISDPVRARIVAAANAARDLIRIRRRSPSQTDDPRLRFQKEAPPPVQPSNRQPPYQQGAEAAQHVRRFLQLGDSPIASVRDLLRNRFPAIHILYAHLTPEGPGGLTFADALRGPAIVLNLDGKNTNPCVRRFSMLHELCHLLVDWNRQQPLGSLSGYLNDARLEIEQRANAFAVRMLCPEQVLHRLAEGVGQDPVAAALELRAYGLHYAALRLYLSNEAGLELPVIPPPELIDSGTDRSWYDAEQPSGIDGFPLSAVPPERRTLVAQAAATAYSQGYIGRDELAEMLGLTPAEEVEAVLDYFALPLPIDPDEVAA